MLKKYNSLSSIFRPFDAKNPFLGNIKVNRELHKTGDRQCMHLEFDIEGSKMRYDAGKEKKIKTMFCPI